MRAGPPDIMITSDASGSWSCEAWSQQKWFQLQWAESIQNKHISVKELVPIVIAIHICGHQFVGKTVLSNCDNSAVVSVLTSRTSKDKDMMPLLRCLFFLEAYFQFHLVARHIPGTSNDCTDDLSRNRLCVFCAKAPQANTYPTPIPSLVQHWLLKPQVDWTSPNWIQQFNTFVRRV